MSTAWPASASSTAATAPIRCKGVYLAFGETRLPARFLTTFSQGLTKDGYFLDCWPAYDRLARLMERQLDLTGWGPILDHGVEFTLRLLAPLPLHRRSGRGARSLSRACCASPAISKACAAPTGCCPSSPSASPRSGSTTSPIKRQRHKQCAFNLFAAAAMEHALAPLARAFGESDRAAEAREASAAASAKRRSKRSGARSAACSSSTGPGWPRREASGSATVPWPPPSSSINAPAGAPRGRFKALAECPPEMGFSYPANAGWRLWALGAGGRADVIVDDFRRRWATMDSVRLNNTLQEDWKAVPDSGQQWSHCAVAPLYVLYMSLLGLRPLEPGFAPLRAPAAIGRSRGSRLHGLDRPRPRRVQGLGQARRPRDFGISARERPGRDRSAAPGSRLTDGTHRRSPGGMCPLSPPCGRDDEATSETRLIADAVDLACVQDPVMAGFRSVFTRKQRPFIVPSSIWARAARG